MSIKNTETESLIRELAEKTGRGQTEAVTIAVQEALERIDENAKSRKIYDALVAIAAETGPLLKDFDMDDALYGPDGLYDRETGLPK